MNIRVAITGAGVVSPVGVGKENVWNALAEARGGIKFISGFDTSSFIFKKAAELSGFDARDYISHKGLGCLSRATQFVGVAGKLAVNEACLDLSLLDRNEIGVVLGTAFGSANSMERFDEECIRDGVRFVDPMSFPNTVSNSPAGYLSILLGAAGLNVTFSTGLASGVAALEYAVRALVDGRARIVLAGGYDELSVPSHTEMLESGLLCASDAEECSAPFDRSRSGLFLGEGACVLALERLEDALARKAPILAEVGGFGNRFCRDASNAIESEAQAMTDALACAGLTAQDIGCVSSSANGSVEEDRAEALAIERVFGERASDVAVTAIKSMIGECGGAAGPIQVMTAALSTQFNAVPPTRGFAAADPGSLLKKISPVEQAVDCRAALVNSFNGRHNNSSVVVKKLSL